MAREGRSELGQEQVDQDRVLLSSIAGLKDQLAIVRAAHALACEGVTRAQASQVAARAEADSGTFVSASIAGKLFAEFGIPTRTAHGRSRLVLDREQLEGILAVLAERGWTG